MDVTVQQIAEVAQMAANAHRYDTQWWRSNEGFHVVCRCGEEFKVEYENVSLPESGSELDALRNLPTLDDAQQRRYDLLVGQHTTMRDAAFKENDDRERGEIRRLLGQHQLAEVVKALYTIL